MGRYTLTAMIAAKMYERLFANPSLAPLVAKYCASRSVAPADCRVLRVCHPKVVEALPRVDQYVESSGHATHWLVCATVGPGKALCHPGPQGRYGSPEE